MVGEGEGKVVLVAKGEFRKQGADFAGGENGGFGWGLVAGGELEDGCGVFVEVFGHVGCPCEGFFEDGA